jgi:hypothetical protein
MIIVNWSLFIALVYWNQYNRRKAEALITAITSPPSWISSSRTESGTIWQIRRLPLQSSSMRLPAAEQSGDPAGQKIAGATRAAH